MMATATSWRWGKYDEYMPPVEAMRRAQEQLNAQKFKLQKQMMMQSQMPMYYAGQVMGVDIGAPCEAPPQESSESKKQKKLRNLIAYYYKR